MTTSVFQFIESVKHGAEDLLHSVSDLLGRPVDPSPLTVDLAVDQVDLVYDEQDHFDAYYFHTIEQENGQNYSLHKVVKVLALDFVPLEAREQLSVLEKMRMALRGLYNAQVDFVYLVAGIFKPYLGITQCYGVIGYDSESRAMATARAERAMGSLRSAMANFEQSRLKRLSRTEVEWIRQAFAEMKLGLVGLGHPDPGRTGKSIQQAQMRHTTAPDEFTLEQNELLYRGMALLGEEFLNVVMAYRVTPADIYQLQVRTSREASRWASMERGTKGINLGLGIPLILSGNLGHAVGTSYGENQSVGVSDATSQGQAHGQGVGLAHTVTQGEAHTDGVSSTTTITDGITTTQGTSHNDGTAHTDSQAHTDSKSHTDSVSNTSTDSVAVTHTDGFSHTDSSSVTQPNGIGGDLQSVPILGDVLKSVSGGNLGGNVTGHGGVPGNTLDGGGGLNAGVNFSTGTNTQGSSDTWSSSDSVSHGHSESTTSGHADTVGTADTKGTADTTSHGDGTSQQVSSSHAVSRSSSVMHSDTISRSVGDSVSASESVAESTSQSHGVSRGLGQSEGRSATEMSGLGVGAGFSPNLSLSKSYQWEDHTATLVADLLRGQENLLREAAVEGAFLVDNYYLCRTERGRQSLAALYAQAFTGTDAVTPAQTRPMDAPEFEYLRTRAMTFTPSTRRERVAGLLETYRDATFLPPLRLAAYTAVGLVEAGRAQTVQERIPPFAFNPHLRGEVIVGHQVMYETGEPTEALCRLSRDKMAHVGIVGDSGAGKSVLATWLEYQIATQWQFRVVILDFGRGHRSLMKIIPPEQFELYGLDDSSPRPIRWNPLQIGKRIKPQTQLEQTCQIIAAAGRMGQRQYGFMWDALRQLYLEHGVLTSDEEVQDPLQFSKTVKARPGDPLSTQRIRLAHVQPEELELLNRDRQQRNAHLTVHHLPRTPWPMLTGDVPLSVLANEDLQLLAAERSKGVDLSLWFDRLEQFQSTKKAGSPDHTALEGVLHRLRPFRHGALRRMYGSGEGSIALEDLGYPYGVAVIEGGTLAEAQKAMILGLAAFHIYQNSIEQRKETMETVSQQEEHPMFLVLEEAHKIINGVSENSGTPDQSGSNASIISAPLWATLARDGRKYHIHYCLIGQSPAAFPEEMMTSCGIMAVSTLKGDKDRKAMMAMLARSTMGFEDNAYLRFLSRMPRAWMIWKTAIALDRKEIEPILIETIMLPVDREPSDSEVAAHFQTWGPLLANLKEHRSISRIASTRVQTKDLVETGSRLGHSASNATANATKQPRHA
ncbi:MAG: serine-rich protein [Chloroflexi bacterium]|nr:serine-rich protein [Chloroflexota bacterium]